jgi:hypothetical protein
MLKSFITIFTANSVIVLFKRFYMRRTNEATLFLFNEKFRKINRQKIEKLIQKTHHMAK